MAREPLSSAACVSPTSSPLSELRRFVFEKKVREDKENIYGSLSQINVAEDAGHL